MRTDRILCSINERLGGGTGEDFEPLGEEWIGEVVAIAQAKADRLKAVKPQPDEDE